MSQKNVIKSTTMHGLLAGFSGVLLGNKMILAVYWQALATWTPIAEIVPNEDLTDFSGDSAILFLTLAWLCVIGAIRAWKGDLTYLPKGKP